MVYKELFPPVQILVEQYQFRGLCRNKYKKSCGFYKVWIFLGEFDRLEPGSHFYFSLKLGCYAGINITWV